MASKADHQVLITAFSFIHFGCELLETSYKLLGVSSENSVFIPFFSRFIEERILPSIELNLYEVIEYRSFPNNLFSIDIVDSEEISCPSNKNSIRSQRKVYIL